MNNILATRSDVLATPQAGHVIAIASGKGGVGKTWLSITLSHILAGRKAGVLLFDADFGLANIDIQLGLTPDRDLCDVMAGRVRLQDAIIGYRGPEGHDPEFGILPGRSGSLAFSALDVSILDDLLVGLRRLDGYDTVVLDLGAGIDRTTRRLAAWADTLLVVTTDEPTALTDAYAVIKLHMRDRPTLGSDNSLPSDIRIIINQATSVTSGERAYATLARACTKFLNHTPPLGGVIRKDASVSAAIRRQVSLANHDRSSLAILDVERLATVLRG